MKFLALDTETCLIEPGLLAPPLVCVSYDYGQHAGVTHHSAAENFIKVCLEDETETLVFHNAAFDMAVFGAKWPHLLPAIFQKYKEGLVKDTMIREQLADIAKGQLMRSGYSLERLAKKYTGSQLDKPIEGAEAEHVRLRYSELLDSPDPDLWPPGFKAYAIADAHATLKVWEAQSTYDEIIRGENDQIFSAFCLHLMSAWGLAVSADGVSVLRSATEGRYEEVRELLIAEKLIKVKTVKKTGVIEYTRDTKAAAKRIEAACEEEGIETLKTEGGGTSLALDSCERVNDPIVQAYGEYGVLSYVMTKDIPMLEKGQSAPIQCRYGLAASGRTTSSSPNIQNLRTLKGIREAFVPRKGMVYVATDFSGLELHTLAQVCITLFGHSKLGEALNEGRDPHTELAAKILKMSYDEALVLKKKDTETERPFYLGRQTAKAANFGFPGGLGVDTFIKSAKASYGVVLNKWEAKALKNMFLSAWPEVQELFSYVNSLSKNAGDDGLFQVEQIISKRLRGGLHYTAACNTFFQGLGADAAKAAHIEVTNACYNNEQSLLFGSRPVAFVHDEIITEIPDDPELLHERAMLHEELMKRGANRFLPDVPSKTETVLMANWSKGAKPKYVDGRLIIS